MIIRKLRDLQSELKQIEIDIREYKEELLTCKRKHNKVFFTAAIKNLRFRKEEVKKELEKINNKQMKLL